MIAWIKRHIRMYFGFSKRETNGVLLLLLITNITILVPFAVYCYDRLYQTAEHGEIDDKNKVVIVEGESYKRKEGDRLKKICNLPSAKYTMKISYQWLKSLIDLDGPPEQIADQLTDVGLEMSYPLPDLVLGKVMERTTFERK